MKILRLKDSKQEDFKSEKDREDHFGRHGKDLNPPAENPEEYQDRANAIAMKAGCYPVGTDHEWWMYATKDGKTVKYNTNTEEFCAYKRVQDKDARTGYDTGKNVEISSYYTKPKEQVIRQLKDDFKSTPLSAMKRASKADLEAYKQFLKDNRIE